MDVSIQCVRSFGPYIMSDVANKWGTPVAERGFAQVPNYLLLLNQFLNKESKLSPVELLVLMQLVGSWWRKDALPFPSMGTLATRCGVSSRQIQRAINRLEKAGLVQRVNRRSQGIISSNAYDLQPLVSLLGEIAKAFPNDFPRKVDKATVEEISAKVGRRNAPAGEIEVVDLDEVEEPAKFVPKPKPKAKPQKLRLAPRTDPDPLAGQIREVDFDDDPVPVRKRVIKIPTVIRPKQS